MLVLNNYEPCFSEDEVNKRNLMTTLTGEQANHFKGVTNYEIHVNNS